MELAYRIKTAEGTRDEIYRHIDNINTDELHELVVDCIVEYGSAEKLEFANKAADVLMDLLKHKGLVTDGVHQSFVDILLATAMIHNIFYEYGEDDYSKLLDTRLYFDQRAEEKGLNSQIREALFAGVEGQLGDKTVIAALRPNPNTPTEMLALAIWIAHNYLGA